MVDELTRYPRAQRALELAGIAVFAVLAACALARMADAPAWLVAASALAGWIAADFLSGLAHWAFDTFGSVRTPVIGRCFIRPFREHHRDPDAMLMHDFVETNGATCLAAVPVLAAAAVMPAQTLPAAALQAFLACSALASIGANQCHKWAHMRPENAPWIARFLQRLRIALTPAAHRSHHVRPFDTHYCTASGWLNVPLDAGGFFRALERSIRRSAGGRPQRGNARPTG